MARDFTDYIAEVMGSGDRVYFQRHFRQLKKDPEITDFELNGRKYLLNKDRAYWVKGYMPWKKWNRKEPLVSLNELLRSKKVGLIKYEEPAPTTTPSDTVEVSREVPVGYSCQICQDRVDTGKGVLPFTTKSPRAMKGHVTRFHKGAKAELVTKVETSTITELQPVMEVVEPMHISRMHQPSGLIRVDGKELNLTEDSLLNIITPRLLKVEIEDDLYRKAYRSYKFGNILPITQKWWLWVVVAVIAIFGILILTGNFKV